MSSSKRAGTQVRGSGMPGAGMHSKVTFDDDAKAKEKRDLTADMDEAAKGSKERRAKQITLEPTPRKGEKSKQARKEDNSGQKGSASNDQAAAAAAGAAAAAQGMEVDAEAGIVHQGSMPVSTEMLGKVQVLNDQVQELRDELREARVIAVEQKRTIDEQAEQVEDLQRVTNTNVIAAREEEEKNTSNMSDTMGTPKAATQREKEAFVEYILSQFGPPPGMTPQSCSSIEVLDTGRGGTGTEEIWRLHFKDFGKKQIINDHIRSQQRMTEWPWRLCFYGADSAWWTDFEIWGRWTEGPIVRLVRDDGDQGVVFSSRIRGRLQTRWDLHEDRR